MCTAISYRGKHHYFGRNLDLEYGLDEKICITPRRYPFQFRHKETIERHYAMIGAALVRDDYPLYFEATNEMGLSMAGLNFPGNAVYHPLTGGKENIASFELISWVLCQCADISAANKLLSDVQVVQTAFTSSMPPSPLHWIVSDREKSIVLESMADGLHIHDNPVGILTNNPPFEFHMYNLVNHRNLNPQQSGSTFSPTLSLLPYSNGMGAIGLPGDLSSASRFVRAAYMKENSIGGTLQQDIMQFFHLLDSVAMPRGSVITPDGRLEITRYSSCCDTVSGIYYYKTYENSRINWVDLNKADLELDRLVYYPMLCKPDFSAQN